MPPAPFKADMKPAISYYGGKQRIASKITPLLPPHTAYVEPFCGGAAVMFEKGLPVISNSDHYREVINDKDSRLINFYRVLKDKKLSEELFYQLDHTLYSREEYETARNHDYTGVDKIADAWAYYIAVMCSFSNVFNGAFGFKVSGSSSAAVLCAKIEHIKQFTDRLRMCTIENDDALAIIDRYDRPYTCFYCDPPYPGTEFSGKALGKQRGYQHPYTQADFEALIDKAKSCQGSFVISNYPNPAITSDFDIHEIKASSSVANDKVNGPELNIKKERTEVVAIIDRHEAVKDIKYCRDRESEKLWPVLWHPSGGHLYGKDLKPKQRGLFDD